MSDIEALKAEKATLITEMLDMQKQFIDIEHQHGISGKDYYYYVESISMSGQRKRFTPVIHAPARLTVLIYLYVVASADFVFLKSMTDFQRMSTHGKFFPGLRQTQGKIFQCNMAFFIR